MSETSAYDQVLKSLDSFSNMELQPSPEFMDGGPRRMRYLLDRLGNPHKGIPAVHVAGTKGKGSVCAMTAAVLGSAGLRTGLYTSPHVNCLRERIIIDGHPIVEDTFAVAAREPLLVAETMRKDGESPTWFEVFTAIALCAFSQAGVQALVLETGLGGRLDATTIADLQLAAVGITAISMDHEHILGHTLSEIASEKAAIIRSAAPVVTVAHQPEVITVLRRRAEVTDSDVFVVGDDISVQRSKPVKRDNPQSGQRFDCATRRCSYADIPLGMLGSHQASNLAVALGLSELFLEYMDVGPLDSMILRRAWRSLQMPARMEVAGQEPWLIIDGAHNPASAWAAAEAMQEFFTATERTLVFGVAADKDWRGMLRILAPLFGRVVCTDFASSRALPSTELAAFVSELCPTQTVLAAADPAAALEQARSLTPVGGLILSAGSFYLAGAIRALVGLV